ILASSALLVICSSGAAAQTLQMDFVPAGIMPRGLDVVLTRSGNTSQYTGVVANSGEDSISLFALHIDTTSSSDPKTISLSAKISGIPQPYAVAACPGGPVLATSPTDNSVWVISMPSGTVLARVPVGAHPNSIACSQGAAVAAVSNIGDNSLS